MIKKHNMANSEIIDDLIDEWHTGDSEDTLRDFLGVTEEEYMVYMMSENQNELNKIENKIVENRK